MIRAWIILSTLVFSVLFRLVRPYSGKVGFLFHVEQITTESWVYYTMEHINAIAIAACFLIHDNTPRWLLWTYFYILCLDMVHYLLFFRDEGIGFNLAKVVVYGSALVYASTRNT